MPVAAFDADDTAAYIYYFASGLNIGLVVESGLCDPW